MSTLHPEDLNSELILSSLQLVLFRPAAIKRLPSHHHSADYLFSGPFGIISLILSEFENRVPLKPFFFCCFLFFFLGGGGGGGGASEVLHYYITA